MYRLRCFGRAVVEDPDGEEVRLRSQKHLALLLYLANERGTRYSRERLASLFWETESRLARHSLSQALYDITQNLPSLDLHRSVRDVGLGDEGLVYEGESFDAAVREERLDEAVDLYLGSFAPGLEDAGGEDFERWLDAERHRYRRLAETALLRHMSRCDDQARWGEMYHSATRLLKMNPLSEEAHRAFMRALWLQGNQEAAVAHFEDEQERLERELPGGVSEETHELVKRIRGSRPALAASAVHETARLPMVGREEEFGTLKRLLAETLEGEGRLAIVHGEAGMGKTRLLEEFHEFAALEGARVLESRCYSAETDVPFGPVVDGLGEIATEFADRRSDDVTYHQLGHLFPGVFEATSHQLDSFLGAGAGRRRLYEEVADLIRRSCTDQPIVWLIDDAHWMDASSTSLVHYLVRRLAEQPVMVVISRRLAAGSPAKGGESFYEDRELAGRRALIAVEPLSIAQSAKLVKSTVDCGTHERMQLAERLQQLSGGTPYFLVELLGSLRDTNWAEGKGAIDQFGALRLSDDARSLIERRLSGLSSDSIRLLEIASVAGKHASPRLFEGVTALSREKIAEDARKLYTAGIIEDRQGSVTFTHDVVREYVYQSMGYLQRSAIHAAVGEVLGGMPERVEPATLAYHFENAGDDQRAFEYAIRAAEEAISRHAYHEGESLSQTSLRCASNVMQRFLAKRNSALARFGTGNFEAAACDLEGIGTEGIDSEERVKLCLVRAKALLELARWQEALSEVARAEDKFADLRSDIRTYYMAEALQVCVKVGMRGANEDIVTDAAIRLRTLLPSLPTGAKGDSMRATAFCNLAVFQLFYDSLNEASNTVKKMSALGDDLSLDAKLQVAVASGMVEVRQGQWDQALMSLNKGHQLAVDARDLRYQLIALNNISACQVTLGQWDQVTRCYQEAQELLTALPDELYLSIPTALNYADSLFYQSRTREAKNEYKILLEKIKRIGGCDNGPSVMASLGLCELRLGNWERAEALRADLFPANSRRAYESVGPQNVFKVAWFDSSIRSLVGEGDAAQTLFDAAHSLARKEYADPLHLEWLALLIADPGAELSGQAYDELKENVIARHQDSGLSWFLYFARRWDKLVRERNRDLKAAGLEYSVS